MSRVAWFAVGAATGVYGILKAKRTAQNLTPGGITARAAAAGAGLRVFSAEVAAGMAEREAQIRHDAALGSAGPVVDGGPVVDVPGRIEGSASPRHRRQQSEGVRDTDGDR